jgi:SAM-dependent methyltransferase
MKLNLGCGSTTPAGWQNVDYAVGARLMKLPGFSAINSHLRLFDLNWAPGIQIHDLRKPFPWHEASVDAIYSSHTFEHLTREQGRHFLREANRVLKPGGVLRLVVPDLDYIVSQYKAGSLSADRFVEELGVLGDQNQTGWKARLAQFIAFPHKCMYDEAALVNSLGEYGFDARRCAAYTSAIEDIDTIELAERTVNAVIVEGTRRQRIG